MGQPLPRAGLQAVEEAAQPQQCGWLCFSLHKAYLGLASIDLEHFMYI